MTELARPLLQTIIDEALAASGARCGWLLHNTNEGFVVVAIGRDGIEPVVGLGAHIPVKGARGYTLASGQPAALMPRPDDHSDEGIGGYPGVPPSFLVAEAGDGTVLLEVAAKRDGSGFTFDDIDTVASLAQVAAAALEEQQSETVEVPSPASLAAELSDLAGRDLRRYREVAALVRGLLGSAT
jgi:hypothetical protein